jgi:predicted Zn finger-like uncharacterized protein
VNTTNDNITRCPQCATAFRVTPEVLQVANGSVRCGSCLRVFNAQAHLLNDKSDQEDPIAPQATATHSHENPQESTSIIAPTKAPTSTKTPKSTSENAIQPDSMRHQTTIESIVHKTPSISPLERPANDTSKQHYESALAEFSNDNSANDEPDESWALELLRESEAAEALLANPTISEDEDLLVTDIDDFTDIDDVNDNSVSVSASKIEDALDEAENLFIDIINNDLQDSSIDKDINELIDKNDADITGIDDDNWAEDLLADENTDPKAAFIPSSEEHSETPHSIHAAKELDDDTGISKDFSQEEPALNLQFERDAISFAEEKPKTKRWPWLIGCLLLLVGLGAQIAWIQFDEWSTQSAYRNYYAKACEILQCQLTDISDISQIRSTHLIVRSHPDEKNALLVDAIIDNSADFQQPFPAIKLIFLDIQGQPIASRAFQPKEYIKGELFGQTIMPARQSIQLSLSIVDPGNKAVNYRLEMVAATPKN